jgi:hypothetical protein
VLSFDNYKYDTDVTPFSILHTRRCYKLNLEYASEAHVFNAWFQPVALPGSGETFKRWGLVERLGH